MRKNGSPPPIRGACKATGIRKLSAVSKTAEQKQRILEVLKKARGAR